MSKLAYLEKYVRGVSTQPSSQNIQQPKAYDVGGVSKKRVRKRQLGVRDESEAIPQTRKARADDTGLFERLDDSDDDAPAYLDDVDPTLIKQIEADEKKKREEERDTHLNLLPGMKQRRDAYRDREAAREAAEARPSQPPPEPTTGPTTGEDAESNAGDGNPSSSSASAPSAGQVIYRDNEGRVIDADAWVKLHESGKKKKKAPEQVLEWGVGLIQKEDRNKKKEEEDDVVNEPVSRYDITQKFDEELRNADRWGDPMTRMEAMEKEGVGGGSATSRPKCRFPAVPNRYDIQPGYRWDGVVRGTGFEDKMLKAKNSKKLYDEEEYKYSVQDW